MIDLHVHSTFSDGSQTPTELIAEAEAIGLKALALTDHDTIGGLPEFLAAAENSPVRAIPGIELSAEHSGGAMHLLGYFINPESDELTAGLQRIQQGRETRNRQILEKLKERGYALTWEEIEAEAGSGTVGRPHFAAALCRKGCFKNTKEVFACLLAKGKPGYVNRFRLTPAECIRLIQAAGGVTVLAHPSTLRLPRGKLRTMVASLKTAGLAGMEVYYPEHNAGQTKVYEQLARQLRLIMTGGSDSHGRFTPDLQLGRGFRRLGVADSAVEKLERRRP